MIEWLKTLFGLKPSTVTGATSTGGPWKATEGPPILTRDDLTRLIHEAGYGEVEAEITALAVPVFHIIAGQDATKTPLGQTRLGGAPDLAVGSVWPRGRHGLAIFLGQFDLADVAARTGSDQLPPSGLLSLFLVEIDGAASPVEVLSVLTPAGTALDRLSPPVDAADFADEIGLLNPVCIAFTPGLSIASGDLERLDLAARFPDRDPFDFEMRLLKQPDGAIGEWLGRGVDNGHGDQRQVAHSRRIGRPNLERYAFITSWEEWLGLKQNSSRLANGTIYRPWQDRHDPEVRWLLDNRAAFDAGVEALQLLVRIESNPQMGLWINDADPIFIMIDEAGLACGNLGELHATVTQG